jgi:hypothetical protein
MNRFRRVLPLIDTGKSLARRLRFRRSRTEYLGKRELPVRIRVQDAADLNGLVAFLKERDYVAEQVGPNTIEVSRLSSVRHDHVRMELDLFLKAWHVANPEAHAEFVE